MQPNINKDLKNTCTNLKTNLYDKLILYLNSNRISVINFIILKISVLLILVLLLLSSNDVMANECVPCASQPLIDSNFVCGVDDKGIARKFSNECALRFENCDKKTSNF